MSQVIPCMREYPGVQSPPMLWQKSDAQVRAPTSQNPVSNLHLVRLQSSAVARRYGLSVYRGCDVFCKKIGDFDMFRSAEGKN